ncbi:MAG: hypothetical protein QOE70_5673 [Chthoniobacter sp.]|jgi:preprotein translocase subunit SecG|nr:hypothetical protein [Chthoniobacter sp.]
MLHIVINLLLAIHVMVSLLIILLVLMQRPKNEGLGAAFGGGMTDNLFGAQTTNVLQTITRYLGGIFFALTLLLTFLSSRQNLGRSNLRERLGGTAPPAATTPTPELPATSPLLPEKGLEAIPEPATPPAPSDAPTALPAPEAPRPAIPPGPTGLTPVETKPAETKPAEAPPVEAKPAETKTAEAPPVEAKPAEAKPAEAKPVEKPGN